MEHTESDKPAELIERPAELPGRFELFVRRLFERVGGALDFMLRRPLNPQPRTDLTTLIPPIERAIEEKLRRTEGRVIAPNLIELRYDYETYGQLTKLRAGFLQRELRATIYEYIFNRRYATLGDVQVKIGFDVFTRGLKIIAQFPDEATMSAPQAESQGTVAAAHEPVACCQITLSPVGGRFGNLKSRLASDAAPAGVGRSRGNAIVIDDATVSSFHAAVSVAANGTLALSDLGSSNGTFVNGVPVGAGERVIIRAGDRLRFGDAEFTLAVTT